MKMNIQFLILFGIIVNVYGQAITNGRMAMFFKFAKPAAVSTLTTAINGIAKSDAQSTKIKTWAKTNFGTPPKNSKDPYANQAYSVNKASQFMVHRAALKTFFAYQRSILAPWLGPTDTSNLVNLFWQKDKQLNNNLTESLAAFFVAAPSKIAKSKVNLLQTKLQSIQMQFAAKDPTAAAALMGFTM